MSLSKKEYTIGRNPSTSDIPINSGAASDRHARISIMDDGSLLLEDLRSSNGTYVNGERVRTKVITLHDKVRIGEQEFMMREHFRTTPEGQIVSFRPANDYTEEFAQLEPVWRSYESDREKIKSRQNTTRFLRSTLPFLLPSIVGVFTLLIENEDKVMGVIQTTVSGLLAVVLAWLLDSPAVQKRREARITRLEAAHRDRFRCPKCQRPFERNLDWDQLALQKKHACGAILTR
jgi:hypothetical protein